MQKDRGPGRQADAVYDRAQSGNKEGYAVRKCCQNDVLCAVIDRAYRRDGVGLVSQVSHCPSLNLRREARIVHSRSRLYSPLVMRRFVLLLVAVILGFATSAAGRRQVSDPETLGTRFFVGQIYPSGNVYLRSFGTDTTNGVRSWPQRLTMVGLPEDGNALSPEKMEVTLSEETVPMAYIPSREGMDDQHNACGPNPPGPLKRDVRYLSEDFYFALSDHCESNEGVAIYRAEPVSYSVRVVAFDLGIPLKDIHRVTGRRPLPDSERSDVALARAEFERSRAECTTEPAFPDESMRILEASMEDGVQVRLSLYTTPGCAGHLATIYILDLLRGDSVLRTFRLSQGQGLL